jgi:hypothetical protein
MMREPDKISIDAGAEASACRACGRPNAPDRATCFYCTAVLEVAEGREASVRINLRPLENWENGFNIVFLPPAQDADVNAIASLLKCEPARPEAMLKADAPFPLARLEFENEASVASERLSGLGIRSTVVPDVKLKIGKPNHRLRSIEFGDAELTLVLFNTGEELSILREDLALVVVGRILDSKTEAVERKKGKGRELLSETATSSDETVVDLYTRNDETGYRLTARGFDFSKLGAEKRLLAAENMTLILNKLRSFAVEAKFVDDHARMLTALSAVWPEEHRSEFEGVRRTGYLRSGYARSLTTSNLEQFNKYSRLQRILL